MAKPRPIWTEKLQSTRPHEVITVHRPMPGWPAAASQPVEPSARETKPRFLIAKIIEILDA